MSIPTVPNFDDGQIPSEGSPTFRSDASYVWSTIPSVIAGFNSSIGAINSSITKINADASTASTAAEEALVSQTAAAASANFKGVWNSATAYTIGQSVSVSGISYRAILAGTNKPPLTEPTFWELNLPFTKAVGNIMSPLLDVQFNNSLNMKSGVGAVTLTRASTATYIDRYGVLKYAAINEPRFEKEGLLIEGPVTNLCLQSSNIGVSWTLNFCTPSLDMDTAPDGTTTADRLIETIDNNYHYMSNTVTVVAGSSVTSSRFFNKSSTETDLKMDIWNVTDGLIAYVRFNPQDGTVIGSLGTYKIEDFGTYFRVQISAIPTVTTISNRLFLGGGLSYIGDGTTYVSVWGAQTEKLAFASSYIPTTTATVTRNAEVCVVDYYNNLPALHKNISIIADFDILGIVGVTGAEQTIFNINGVNYILGRVGTNSTIIAYYGSASGTTTTIGRYVANRFGMTLKDSTLYLYKNGVQLAETHIDDLTTGAYTSISIGNFSGTRYLYGHISNFRVYDRALTVEEFRIA